MIKFRSQMKMKNTLIQKIVSKSSHFQTTNRIHDFSIPETIPCMIYLMINIAFLFIVIILFLIEIFLFIQTRTLVKRKSF